jgi:hypothetical protein
MESIFTRRAPNFATLASLLDSLEPFIPSLEHLHLDFSTSTLPPEAAGLADLIALKSLGIGLKTFRQSAAGAPPPPFASLPALLRLCLSAGNMMCYPEQAEAVVIDRRWDLPALEELILDGALSPASSDLAAAFPALRELYCHFACSPDDLPALPPSLSKVTLHVNGRLKTAMMGAGAGGAPRFAADRVLRWTDASPLSALPALSDLTVQLSLSEEEAKEAAGDYIIQVPPALAARLQRLVVERPNAHREKECRVVVRAPAALGGRLVLGRRFMEPQDACTVEWV